MSLGSLAPLMRREPATVDLLAAGTETVAVPEAATAYVLAGMLALGERRPVVVVTPTVAYAERLAHDVQAFASPGSVKLFPAWETLPFERVSPDVHTMGSRLELLWRLGALDAIEEVEEVHREQVDGERGQGGRGDAWHRGEAGSDRDPSEAQRVQLVVAPVRALLQRLGPLGEAAFPRRVTRGERLDQSELVATLVAMGYRREYQVEHRGEVAVRGGIVDVFPSTSEMPVRIDLWGDEVDRLTEFDPGDQRSVGDLEEVEIFACRELLPTEPVRAKAATLVGSDPWG
ncbi:MAG TPA: hypothetical protein VEJ87_02685, partial [Acidimicrobiales bacterium]|nr:hypothetical protein [Acidimicrobiales bacterium]